MKQSEVESLWLHSVASSLPSVEKQYEIASKNQGFIPKFAYEGVTFQQLPSRSSFIKLKELHKELSTTYDRVKFNFDACESNNPQQKGNADFENENDEAKLLLHVNNMCAPKKLSREVTLNLMESVPTVEQIDRKNKHGGGRLTEIDNVEKYKDPHFDQKEKAKQAVQMARIQKLAKYKELYYATLKSYQDFKNSTQKSISKCQNEIGATIESLQEAHNKAVEVYRQEKADLEIQVQNTKREVVQLECKSRCLEDELAHLKDQYNQKCKETEVNRMDNSLAKSQREGLTQAHNILYERMSSAEERNDVYKGQLEELSQHNASLMDTISKMSTEYAKELGVLKDQLESVINENQNQHNTFTATISELADAFQAQVAYTEVVVNYAKERESKHETAKTTFTSCIGKTIKKCTSMVTCLEQKLRVLEDEKKCLGKEISDLKHKFKTQEENHEKAVSVLCAKCEKSRETTGSHQNQDIEAENARFVGRIAELEQINEVNNQIIQRIQLKNRKLAQKYIKCKEGSEQMSDEIKKLRTYTSSLEKDLQPLFSDQIYQMELQISEAQMKHAQFQAILQGIKTNSRQPQDPDIENTESKE